MNWTEREKGTQRRSNKKLQPLFFTLVNPILWVLMRVESDGRVKKTAPTNAVKFRETEADTHTQHFSTHPAKERNNIRSAAGHCVKSVALFRMGFLWISEQCQRLFSHFVTFNHAQQIGDLSLANNAKYNGGKKASESIEHQSNEEEKINK